MIIPFCLPAPPSSSKVPIWDGQSFILDDQKLSVLEYSENYAGWSDDLTTLHETITGDKHPIDIASRADAITQAKRCLAKYCAEISPTIVEVGCSSGYLLRTLVATFPQATVVGADVVKAPLLKLASELPGVPLMRFDLLQCPLPEQTIDVLIMLNVLEHIEDDLTALHNAFKLLKPGGCLVIEVPAGPSLYDFYDAALLHFRRYSAVELRKKLTAVGFEVTRLSHLGFILYPAFSIVKLLNKVFPSRENTRNVGDQITATSGSVLVRFLMKFESNYLSRLHLPFGIRVLSVARRPIQQLVTNNHK